ncbi:uncharacterized protein LOC111493479 [Cucurbita maxima]|uniref:Uncharacterized protein LOC111493479 n=1 Tax=Cucurbita maxima TaxID=3661 RepID=A0A6J1KI86_CUCMA|nr:uncharacterized protein LOC111493479 [Cucurbita maxima]
MEIEPIRPAVKKKLWNVLRAVVFMLRKGLNKSKIVFDLHLMLKRSKLAGKAMANLVEFHHGSAFSCQTIDIANSYISTRDYEFSCSNSPAYPFRYFNKHRKHQNRHYFPKSYRYDDFSTVTAVQRVLDILHSDQKSEASPLVPLPGFGKSPLVVRQLRVTDSPFSLKDDSDSQIVDKAAEEFIKKFYTDLRLEKSLAAYESPFRNTLCR